MSRRTLVTVVTALIVASCDQTPTVPAVPDTDAASAAVVGGLSQLKNHLVWTDGYVDDSFHNQVIWITDPDGTNVRTLTHGAWPSVHPDGRQIAFIREESDGSKQAYVMPTHGGVPVPLAPNAVRVTWSPTGSHLLYYDDAAGRYAVIDAIGSSGHKLSWIAKFVEWSADGTQLFFFDPVADELIKYTLSGAATARTALPADASFIDVSPDESKAVYSRWGDEIWTTDLDSGDARRVARGYRARWSPDGTRIAWTRERQDGDWELRVMDQNGCGKMTLARETSYSFAWSRNGRRVFVENRSGVLAVKVDASQVSYLGQRAFGIPVQRPPEPVEPSPLPLATPICTASP